MYRRFLLAVASTPIAWPSKASSKTIHSTTRFIALYIFLYRHYQIIIIKTFILKNRHFILEVFHPYFINCVVWLSVYRFLRMSVIDSKLNVRCTVTKIKHLKNYSHSHLLPNTWLKLMLLINLTWWNAAGIIRVQTPRGFPGSGCSRCNGFWR